MATSTNKAVPVFIVYVTEEKQQSCYEFGEGWNLGGWKELSVYQCPQLLLLGQLSGSRETAHLMQANTAASDIF